LPKHEEGRPEAVQAQTSTGIDGSEACGLSNRVAPRLHGPGAVVVGPEYPSIRQGVRCHEKLVDGVASGQTHSDWGALTAWSAGFKPHHS